MTYEFYINNILTSPIVDVSMELERDKENFLIVRQIFKGTLKLFGADFDNLVNFAGLQVDGRKKREFLC